MRVLIVRLSSMGDLVLTFPALTDALKRIPGITFDWVVDQSFADVPSWHKGVKRIIQCKHRAWSRNLRPAINGEFKSFLSALRANSYDYIIDMQGRIKSAVVTRLAKGLRCGYDHSSVYEWGSQLVYQKKFSVPMDLHQTDRMRQLLAQVLGYTYADEPDYGIDKTRFSKPSLELPKNYLIFIHSTSWDSKHWPESHWKIMVEKAQKAGFQVILPWGSEKERQKSIRIAAKHENAIVLPDLNLSQKAYIIEHANATLGCDTGLSHIAAALDVPSLTLYGPTDPLITGNVGRNQQNLLSHFECLKCNKSTCRYNKETMLSSACLSYLRPEFIWERFQEVLNNSATGSTIGHFGK